MSTILPAKVIFNHWGEIIYKFEAPEETLLAAEIISQDNIPSSSVGSCKSPDYPGGVIKCSRLGNGNLRATVCATMVIDQDSAFKQFLGGILADTRLSLVKGESA